MKKNIILFFYLAITIVLYYSKANSEDIRSLGIDVNIQDINTKGYKNLLCLNSEKSLLKWTEYKKCKKDNNNLSFITFEYDDRYAITEEYEGTQVAGHPVQINVGINQDSIIEEINVKTDPDAPWYFRKQSYLLWLRIYNKYGSDKWNCLEKEPADGHLLVGKKYINKICEKSFKKKKVILHTEFYFKNNKKDKKNLVSRTRMKIEKVPTS